MDLWEIGWGWSGFNWLRIGLVAFCFQCGNKHSGFEVTELVSVVVYLTTHFQ
jgi:hypothetical protein